MTTLPTLTAFGGTIPNKATQTDTDFANNIFAFINYSGNTLVTDINTNFVGKLNTLSGEINTLATTAENAAIIANGLANYKGDYDPEEIYAEKESVSVGENYYISKVNNNVGNVVTDTNFWLDSPINKKLDVSKERGFKNEIVNGNFEISTRGTSAFTSDGHTIDGWFSFISGGQVRPISSTIIPYVEITINNGTDTVVQEQRLERPLRFSGKTRTLSCYLFGTPASTNAIKYSISLKHVGGVATLFTGSYPIGTGFKSITVTIPDLSGYTLDAESYLKIRPFEYISEGWTGTVGLNQVQFEEGSIRTIYENRLISLESLLYGRFLPYRSKPGQLFTHHGIGIAISTTTARINLHNSKLSRKIPTSITFSGNFSLYGPGGSITVTNMTISFTSSENQIVLEVTVASGLTQYSAYELRSNSDSSAYIEVSSEF